MRNLAELNINEGGKAVNRPAPSRDFIDLSDNPASVKLCRHDEGMRLIEVAPTFEVFIDELSLDPDMI